MTNTKKAISEYLAVVKRARAARTHSTYSNALHVFAKAVGLGPLTTEAYIAFLRATSDVSPASQAIYRSAVLGLYMFCASSDPTINVDAVRQANKQYALRKGHRLPTFDQVAIEKIVKYCAGLAGDLVALRDRAFVLTMVDSGLRISEACALLRGSVDWNEGRAVIIGKGDKEDVVHFSTRAMAALKRYLRARAELDGASGRPLEQLPLFARHDLGAGKKVKPIRSGGMWYAIKERAKEAGVDPAAFRVHDFRHYFVTVVYASSHDLKLAQNLARHSDIAITSRYAHLVDASGEAYGKIFNEDK